MAAVKGRPRTEAEKRNMAAGRARAKLEREKARTEGLAELKEMLKIAAPAALGLTVGTGSAILCRTPRHTAMLMGLPLSPIRLVSIPGVGGGDALHDAYVRYLTDTISEITGRTEDQTLHVAQRAALGGLVGASTYIAVEFIRQLGGIARGIGEAVPG